MGRTSKNLDDYRDLQKTTAICKRNLTYLSFCLGLEMAGRYSYTLAHINLVWNSLGSLG